MPPIVLKIEGNESLFSNLNQDELEKTWRVCTKVKDSLENGSRLENLSWRLWFIQNVLVSNDIKSGIAEVSVLDYSLDEIKPVGTENFTLNQFTSDQEGDQMIELKDIFPFEMQDYMFTVPEQDPLSENQFSCNTSSWQQYPSYYLNEYSQQNIYTDPITGVQSLLAGQIDQTPTENMLQQQPNIAVDYPAYLTAASALPNATLHNKLLATLPRQTLESAERLLSSCNKRTQKMTESLPSNNQQHYFNTFQLDPANLPTTNTNYDSSDKNPLHCSNCDTTTTPLWRRSTDEKVLCNACGL